MRKQLHVLSVTALCVLSIVAPLFAGYCIDCDSYPTSCGNGCHRGNAVGPWPNNGNYCVTCSGTIRQFCTACRWERFQCVPNQPGYPASCAPPYVWEKISEDNQAGLISCTCRPGGVCFCL
jgi:hypothetical protein